MADAENITSKVSKTNSKKQTKKEKELLRDKANQENITAAVSTIESINRNHHSEVNRNIRNKINEIVVLLNDEKSTLSVRAANAISVLDRLTQDKGMKSHIRTMLWQVVSNLEGIRE